MTSVPLENAPVGQEAFAAGNHLWQAPPSPANEPQQAQQQSQHPVATPVPVQPMPVRPVQMPVAPPPSGARPMQMPGPIVTPPFIPPRISMPLAPRIPVTPIGPMPGPAVRPPLARGFTGAVLPGPAMRAPLPGAPRARIGGANGAAAGGPLPVPPKFGHIALEPGLGGAPAFTSSRSATGFSATAPPAQFCITSLPNCGRGFGLDGDFDFDDGFGGPPLFFFAFGGPFGFGGPCLFDGFFLNCFSTGWNGPFGWGWTTPWGYDPSGTGLMYPVAGGYYSPTPVEQNQASVESPGPSAFLPPTPAPLTLAPEEAPATSATQPVVLLILKDGTDFGATSYWLQDNRLYYVTTYGIQSSIPIDQLDLQATVDINYKRGITFTLTPKQDSQKPPDGKQDPVQSRDFLQ